MLNKKALAAAVSATPVYVEDVFSTWLYTGNGSTQTITNGIDLSGKGGMVWSKQRSGTTSNWLYDTERGNDVYLLSNDTLGNQTSTDFVTYNNNGYEINISGSGINGSGSIYASWTFRKQDKFFDVVTYTGDGIAGRTVSHSLGAVPGCIIIKCTSFTSNWIVYHRSIGNDNQLQLNETAAQNGSQAWNTTTPTSSVFTLGSSNSINGSGRTYVAYLFAHDAGGFGASGTDNVISCGTYAGNGSGSGSKTINLGYEPQLFIVKRSSGGAGSWWMIDNMRGATADGSDALLYANGSAGETTDTKVAFTSTGVTFYDSSADFNASGSDYIYIAIRRGPMRTPTDATKVFLPSIYTGDATSNRLITTNFLVDAVLFKKYETFSGSTYMSDRLRGVMRYVYTNEVGAETTTETNIITGYDSNKGVIIGSDSIVNGNTYSHFLHAFRRAPGFFDVVCYTGTGSATTQTHNLKVAPELMIVKNRSDATGRAWAVWHSALANTDYLVLNTNAAKATSSTYWNSASPTSSVFSIGTANSTNESSDTFVAYLFASLTGVSKVGSYTGNGSNQTINCGFTNGARFVLIKRTDSTGDWVMFDTARGIVAGNDPYLLLNSTNFQVTDKDAVDTNSTGFVVNETTGPNINTNNATYIYLAIA